MGGRRKGLAIAASLAFLVLPYVVSCSDKDSRSSFVGIGSVEKNDSVAAVHYYELTLKANDVSQLGGVPDSARVYFVGRGAQAEGDETGLVFDVDFSSISEDLREPIAHMDSSVQVNDSLRESLRSGFGFYAFNIHITRDWRRNDFLDVSTTYCGTEGGLGDRLQVVCDTMGSAAPDSLIVLWLRLSRHSEDTTELVTRHISVPVNELRDSTKERVYLRLMRIDAYQDTVKTDYVYSYVNFVD